jgi:glycosyltransferase involved in cell wall biosynthesis
MCTNSIVIPCYCSGPWLEELVRRIDLVMRRRGEPFEVVLVNDASPDDTWKTIQRLARRYDCVRGIDLLFNTGQFRATLCGLEQAAGELIVVMDDDLQHPPEEIPKLIDAIRRHPELDCVMGAYAAKHHNLVRNLGSRLWAYVTARIYGLPTHVKRSSFRIMRREIARAICLHRTVRPVLGPLIFRTTARVGNVRVNHHPRRRGQSGYGVAQLARIVLDNVFSASTLPLRMVSVLGLGSAAGSVLWGGYNVAKYFLGSIKVPGFVTLVLLITFFGGMTLFAVGLLGEYLIRVIDEVRRPPRYLIRHSVGKPTRRRPPPADPELVDAVNQ